MALSFRVWFDTIASNRIPEYIWSYVLRKGECMTNNQTEYEPQNRERFLPMWQEGRDSDTVKKVHLKGQICI